MIAESVLQPAPIDGEIAYTADVPRPDPFPTAMPVPLPGDWSEHGDTAMDVEVGQDGEHGGVVVYTDGACLGNPGPGGWAWVMPGGRWACGAEPRTTNQRMELTAALEALREIADGPVEVVSDSAYVVNCFRDEWHVGWRKRDWRTSGRKPVANRDLWEPLIELFSTRAQEISWRWVKGHSGDQWNSVADQLAHGAARDQLPRRGGSHR